jgi:hypothetical protein
VPGGRRDKRRRRSVSPPRRWVASRNLGCLHVRICLLALPSGVTTKCLEQLAFALPTRDPILPLGEIQGGTVPLRAITRHRVVDAQRDKALLTRGVVSPPLCTAPSACGSTSCGEPRGVSGTCGLRAVGVAPSRRQRGIGPTRRPRKHPWRQRRCTSLPARDPSRSRSVPAIMTKATSIGQMGRKRTIILSDP